MRLPMTSQQLSFGCTKYVISGMLFLGDRIADFKQTKFFYSSNLATIWKRVLQEINFNVNISIRYAAYEYSSTTVQYLIG